MWAWKMNRSRYKLFQSAASARRSPRGGQQRSGRKDQDEDAHLYSPVLVPLAQGLLAFPQHVILALPDVSVPLELVAVMRAKELVEVEHAPSGVHCRAPLSRSRAPFCGGFGGGRSGPGSVGQVELAQEAAVVLPPQALVTQHRVGLADVREADGGIVVAGVLVRVVEEALLVVCGFDLSLGSLWRHAEDVVVARFASVKRLLSVTIDVSPDKN